MWPLGNFYQEAKVRSLTALTVGIKANPRHWVPLSDWRKFSSISIVSSTASLVNIKCNSAELRSSLVAEIEAWADHELEMRAQVMRSAQSGSGFQDSWYLVSIYYWAVFSGCLLLRLLGTPVFRMGANDLTALKGLASPGSAFPAEGTFRLEQVGVDTATTESIKMTRLKANYHQALWVAVFSALNAIQVKTKIGNSNQTERDLVAALLDAMSGKNWRLSDLRNLVNYRSNVGFPASLSGVGFSVFDDARATEELDSTKLFLGLSRSAMDVKRGGDVVFDRANARFMFWTAVTLSVLAQSLYGEVSSLIKFDSSWASRRNRFGVSETYGVPDSYRKWAPF